MNDPFESTPARPADASAFYTCRHPDLYHADWKGYYARAWQQRAAVCARHRHALNVKYGPSPYHAMDIFMPASAAGAPVLLYFHGGRLREGHPAFYDCLATPWVEDGAIFVSCGYRLEPAATIADSVDDGLAVVRWWTEHARDHGGDPRRIVIAGHSAGGYVAAMLALTPRANDIPAGARIAGAIIMSGVSDLAPFQPDADPRLSPAGQVCIAPPHVIVSYGSPEPNRKGDDDWLLTRQGERLDRALTDAGLAHQTIVLGRLDHVGTAAAFVDPASPLHRASLDAVRCA